MKEINVDLQYCYGIKNLKTNFDFSNDRSVAIYAPNGSMKSSLAQTFEDVVNNTPSKDRIFPKRKSNRNITDENANEISKDKVVVIRPYDEILGHTEKTSTLLVDSKLRKEYEDLHEGIDNSKVNFLNSLIEVSGTKKKDLDKEISATFTPTDDLFFVALMRIKEELESQDDAPFADVVYDKIFDEKVLKFLNTGDFKSSINEYIQRYNELLDASTYFKRGIFNYYNAETIAKSLADNGFFNAKHSVSLNADVITNITTQEELTELINKEKEGISKDSELKKKFDKIEKSLNKNINLRNFHGYLLENEWLLPHLANIGKLKEEIWKSYIKVKYELYKDLIENYQKVIKRKKEIEAEAEKQRTQWESVIDIFNSRFFVPFTLSAKNRIAVILGQEPLLNLGFTYSDDGDEATLEKSELLMVLSQGEKKALYILNIIFEVEVRKNLGQETVFIVDDIADSFDYKNKYAIIEYLRDISDHQNFYQIILTHNFDFFRTVNSRFVSYPNCLMVFKSSKGLTLDKAAGIKNVFVNDWKPNFYDDTKKKIASIPFIRNIIEYTKGDKDPHFIKLTSLLHWKEDSDKIKLSELDEIYNTLFGGSGSSNDSIKTVIELIQNTENECVNAEDGVNFENKIVLSIAIRINAEKYMINNINDQKFVSDIQANQTVKLFNEYKSKFSSNVKEIEILQRVVLMTPESIHLNSFMYEPILDMSDEHLKRLSIDVKTLD